MSAQDIIQSLTGQKVSQKSTFLPHTLNNLIHDISHKTRDNSSMLVSLGYIIFTGNGSCDTVIEVCCNKRNYHLEIFCSHNGKELRGNALNHFSRYRTSPRKPPALAGGGMRGDHFPEIKSYM